MQNVKDPFRNIIYTINSFIIFSISDTILITNDIRRIEILMHPSLLLEEVEITKRKGPLLHSKINVLPVQVVTVAGLQKLACCNIGESFESNVTVDVCYTDTVCGAKKSGCLDLTGYRQKNAIIDPENPFGDYFAFP